MKSTNLLSLISAGVLAIYIVLAIGTFFGAIPTDLEYLGNGIYKKSYLAFNPFILEFGLFTHEGTRDERGRWHGEIKTMIGDRLSAIGNVKNGKRDGKQIYYDRDGNAEEVFYKDGKRIEDPNQSNQSGYILSETIVSQNNNYSDFKKITKYNYRRYQSPSNGLETYDKDKIDSFIRNAVSRILIHHNVSNRIDSSSSSNRPDYQKSETSFSPEYYASNFQGISDVPSYGYLEYESPWFIVFMEHYDFDSSQVKAFLTDIENHISGSAPSDETEFTFAFFDAVDSVSEKHEMSEVYRYIDGIEVSEGLKSFELRLAVIDRHLDSGKSTFEILEEEYPDFLAKSNEWIENDSIKAFTEDLDSRMDSEEPFDTEDPFLAEEIEARMFLKLEEMIDEEVHTNVLSVLLLIFLEVAAQSDPVHEAVKLAYFETTVSVEPVDEIGVPKQISLEQNYPNPFNPSTIIRYGIPERNYVQLSVYNTTGQLIHTLVNEVQEAGYHEVVFDASSLPSGVYIYRLKSGDYIESKKLLFLK